jgi:wyosine [tRNA(Phe)-imidazoG37] synthetase (radical SAM superfamily)
MLVKFLNSPRKSPDFRKISREHEVTYGPVSSRRLGKSLGVNVILFPNKTCTFDCVYCQYGRTLTHVSLPSSIPKWRKTEFFVHGVEKRLKQLRAKKGRLDSLTFSGYGEPTLYPELKELASKIKEISGHIYPSVPIRILTNSSLVGVPSVYDALKEFDYIVGKLDVGEQNTFQKINRPLVPTSLDQITNGLKKLSEDTGKVVLQTLIFRTTMSNIPDNIGWREISALTDRIGEISPLEVQFYTVDRYPSEVYVTPIDKEELQLLAEKVNEKLGKKIVKVY